MTAAPNDAATRRSLLKAGAGLAAASGSLGLTALLPILPADMPIGATPALAAIEPDAELIHACAGYVAALDAFNRHDGQLEPEDDPSIAA